MKRLSGVAASAALALAACAEPNVGGLRFDESTRVKQPKRYRSKVHTRRYDKAGMPHNGSGDKLVRKTLTGTVGVRGSRKGFLDNWSSTKVGSMGLGDRRRAKG